MSCLSQLIFIRGSMKRTKLILAVISLFLVSCTLLSCKNDTYIKDITTDFQSETTVGSTATDDNIAFEEISNDTYRFTNMTEDNYFDVTDFTVSTTAAGKTTPIVDFSFIPPETRSGIDVLLEFAHSNTRFKQLKIYSYYADQCLDSIMNMKAIKLWRYNVDDKAVAGKKFSAQFGVNNCIEFTHNEKRDNKGVSKNKTDYCFLISPLTAENTYYVYDQNTAIVAEVDGEYLTFLSYSSEEWYDPAVFMRHHIALVKRMEIYIKDGTDAGVCGVRQLMLEHSNTDANGNPLEPHEVIYGSGAVLHVNAQYNNGTQVIEDIPKYRKFYQSLLYSSLEAIDISEERQAYLNGRTPDLQLIIHLECGREHETIKYNMFADGSVVINSIYVGKFSDGRVDKLIEDVGLMLSNNAADVIVPYA